MHFILKFVSCVYNNVICNFIPTVINNKILAIFVIIIITLFGCNKSEKINYKFSGKDLCNNSNGIPIKFITAQDIKKNGIRKIFDFQKNEKKDSVFISFKMISDCCQNPKDSLIISKSEIKLIADFKSSSLCDCYCDYLFEYKMSKEFIKNRKILTENN